MPGISSRTCDQKLQGASHGNIYADGKDCRFKRLESAYRIDAAIHIRDCYA